MNDTIRQAVELADGWASHGATIFGNKHHTFLTLDDQTGLDALAAQLVRQVDDIEYADIYVHLFRTIVHQKKELRFDQCGKDRTLNTITAIVKSGVLK